MMELHDYQIEGVEFLRRNKKVYFAFSMGMGKTITALASELAVCKKNVLLIAEKNEIVNSKNFEREVETHFPDVSYVSLRDCDLEDMPYGKVVAGANPELLEKIDLKQICAYFDAVIVDEATLAKTATSRRFKRIRDICRKMEYVVLLSGTPMMNGAAEIFAPLVLLGHPMAGDGSAKARMSFERIFAGGHWVEYFKKITGSERHFYKPRLERRWEAKGANNVRELRMLIEDHFLFKRKEDTNAFRKKERLIEYVEVNSVWQTEYDRAWDDYLGRVTLNNVMGSGQKRSIKNIMELKKLIENGQVYQVNSRWKARQVVKDIASGKYGDRRIIVFSMFIETDQMIQEELENMGIGYRTFDDVQAWKEGDEQVLVGRIKSHGKGGNVPEASVTLFVDMDFVPANNLQAEGRMDRPQQTRDMIVRYYMAKDETMIDHHVRKIVATKTRKVDEFMRHWNPGEKEEVSQMLFGLRQRYNRDFELLDGNGLQGVKLRGNIKESESSR